MPKVNFLINYTSYQYFLPQSLQLSFLSYSQRFYAKLCGCEEDIHYSKRLCLSGHQIPKLHVNPNY